jgi:hypothetical protein
MSNLKSQLSITPGDSLAHLAPAVLLPSAQVPEAVCLPSLTYHEAWELSYFGANVLHPRTTLPAMKYSIPIAIRNFFNLSAPGAPGRAKKVVNGGGWVHMKRRARRVCGSCSVMVW